MSSKENNNQHCPNFPFFGASYPDAGCFDGTLRDLDDCGDEGVYEHSENWPCPFCRTEAFIKEYTVCSGKKFGEVRKMVKELKEKHNYKKDNQ